MFSLNGAIVTLVDTRRSSVDYPCRDRKMCDSDSVCVCVCVCVHVMNLWL